MNFTVVWTPFAEQKLATIWNTAADRAAVAAAANETDQFLAKKPRLCGESRGGALRVMFVGPLGIEYKIIEEDRQVRILAVWQVRRPG
jgi:plasmid stabilization system protein ParE